MGQTSDNAAGNIEATPVTGTVTVIAPVTPPAAVPAQPDLQAVAEEWKKRATGWQTKFQQEQAAHVIDAEKARLTEEALTLAKKELDETKANQASLVETSGKVKSDLELLQNEHERLKIVATEFPQFLPLMREGALPAALGDDLRNKLKALASVMSAGVQQGTQQQLQGAVPLSPDSSKGPKTAEGIKTEAMVALHRGDATAYNKLMDEYYKAISQASTK